MKENNTFKEELFFEMWDYLKYLCGGLYPEWQSGSNTTKLFDKHGNLLIEYRDKIELNEYLHDVTKLKKGEKWKMKQIQDPITTYKLANGSEWVIGNKGVSNE